MNCPRCLKISALCVCDALNALGPPVQNRVKVLILQHPQEPDKDLGSAHLAHLVLAHSSLKVGLSWPNLSRALTSQPSSGQAHPEQVQPQRWATLYLGSGIKPDPAGHQNLKPGLHFVTRQGALAPKQPSPGEIDGLIILDGTWSQAKALWWRNAWLLKTKRAVLRPSRQSMYRELRREPRRECLSTIESIAESLVSLGEPSETGEKLRQVFGALLQKRRDLTGQR